MAEPADNVLIPISITICGDGGCGKSSITLRLVRSQWTSEYDPTIEDSYSLTRRIDGATYHLSLTDTAGQEEYRGMWASSNLGADAFLLVYDITSRNSLDALQYFNDLIDMEAETRADNAERAHRAGLTPTFPPGAEGRGGGGLEYNHYGTPGSSAKIVPPVKIVAGNKCDLQESRQVPAAMGLEWSRRRGCGFMETSARNEVNIEETFALIVRRVVEARRAAESGGEAALTDRRGVTKPLSPLPGDGEKRGGARGGAGAREPGVRGPNLNGGQLGRGGAFWRSLRCW
ncbi:related to GTPase Ras2p [Cephalotrichum gorgonifer]|uniref:Related to GTPase Ras2p n=1 Tax=Cephalotrichum gorgonifer TaxID=2041049 RepID=A0AAE8SU73_9PEZI|nr:related to GTPase Ras2p [Cephalotrichum gorgonifer]